MSFMLNEQHISFSATLASTIGLEETILLQVLTSAQQWLSTDQRCCIFQPQIEHHLPFWKAQDIQRIAKNLTDKGIIKLHSAPYTQSLRIDFNLTEFTQPSMSNNSSGSHNQQALHQNASQEATHQPAMQVQSYGANILAPNWQPDHNSLALLAQHQIPANFIQQQVNDFVLYWRERGEVSHAWGSRFVKQVQRNWQMQRKSVGFEPQAAQTAKMNRDWNPSEDALEILQRIDIPLDFIQESIPEFILYWLERGNTASTWNSNFVKHIKRQWASYTTTLQYDNEPKIITKNWQPNNDALEVLELANIDRKFALSEIPSFVLFWLEKKQAHNSWNSKFIQHAKYQWAKRHHLNIDYAHEKQQNTHGSNLTKDPDFNRRHSDTSWAEGI